MSPPQRGLSWCPHLKCQLPSIPHLPSLLCFSPYYYTSPSDVLFYFSHHIHTHKCNMWFKSKVPPLFRSAWPEPLNPCMSFQFLFPAGPRYSQSWTWCKLFICFCLYFATLICSHKYFVLLVSDLQMCGLGLCDFAWLAFCSLRLILSESQEWCLAHPFP